MIVTVWDEPTGSMVTVEVPELQVVAGLPPVAINLRSPELMLKCPDGGTVTTTSPALTISSEPAEPDAIVSVIAGLLSVTGVSTVQSRSAADTEDTASKNIVVTLRPTTASPPRIDIIVMKFFDK